MVGDGIMTLVEAGVITKADGIELIGPDLDIPGNVLLLVDNGIEYSVSSTTGEVQSFPI